MQKRSSSSYFFELLVSDVPRVILHGLNVLYHGSLDGAFGHGSDEVDLSQIQAIKINISHTSCPFLSSDYEYNVVFYSRELADSIWNSASREKKSELRALTRRVSLSSQKGLLARRIIDNLFIQSRRPIYFTKFDERIQPDYSVPLAYHRQLFNEFESYLMRCPCGFPLVRSLFQAQGLDLIERRLTRQQTATSELIVTYVLQGIAKNNDAGS